MPREGFDRAAVPARALAAKDAEVFGNFGPADRLGQKNNPVRLACVDTAAVKTNDLGEGVVALQTAKQVPGLSPAVTFVLP